MAGGPSTPALVLAAAAAGGLGFLAGGYKSAEQLATNMAQVRASGVLDPQSGTPASEASASRTPLFGVNLFAPNPVPIAAGAFARYMRSLQELADSRRLALPGPAPQEDDDAWAEKVELLVSDPVPVVSFTFGLPSPGVVRRLHRAGSVLVQTVTSPDEARQAAALGIDALVVQSFEAGGHSGTLTPAVPPAQLPLPELLRQVRFQVQLPLWAAGGISTPVRVHAVLAHGAEAAVVGTVLLRSPESGASRPHRDALVQDRPSLVTTAFSGRPARALRNGFTDRFNESAPLGYPAIHHLTSPLRKAAAAAGDAENISLWAGTGYRDASDEPAAAILGHLAGAT